MKSGWLLVLAAPPLLLALPGLARADDPPGCPPGEWFCDDSSGEPAPPEGLPPDEMPEAPPGDDVDAGPWDERDRASEPAPDEGDVDLERSAPSSFDDSGWSEGSGGRPSPWGLALRVEGVLLDGKRRDRNAHLGGVGVSGRYALNRVVALDLGLDSIVGTDYNGYDRSEVSLSFSSLFFLNYHPVVRTYVLIGLNTSRARVDVPGDEQTWGYFGGQTGLGIDISLDRRVSLAFDAIAFMRGRTDSRAEREPEFTDERGRVTNTSGGGLLRGGVTLHF